MYIFHLDPVPKPRMTQSDKWNVRKCVANYLAFKDVINIQARQQKFILQESFTIIFRIALPKSWGNIKRAELEGKPHKQKPDVDNLLKAFTDALTVDDAGIWKVSASKFWAPQGSIEVF